jgi:hypothetical protein
LSWLSIGVREAATDAEGRVVLEPGGRVRVTAAWMLERTPERVELHLLWYTEGKGTQDVGLVASRELGSAAEGSVELDLPVPVGPWSFSGRLVSVLWALELVAEPELGVERLPLVVAPGGRERRLETVVKPEPRGGP